MGFLDNVKEALRDVVSSHASKDAAAKDAASKDAASKDAAANEAAANEAAANEAAANEPGVVVEPETPPAATFETYTVRTGDSLPEIGTRFGVSVEEIVKLNDIENPDLIFPGQVFRIPTS